MQFPLSSPSRWISWITLVLLVTLAIFFISLRLYLLYLGEFKTEVSSWVSERVGKPVCFGNAIGYWRHSHLYVSLSNLTVDSPDSFESSFEVDTVELELDLFRSLLNRQVVISKLGIRGLKLALQTADIPFLSPEMGADNNISFKSYKPSWGLSRLLLSRVNAIKITDSQIFFLPHSGKSQTLFIEDLSWRYQDKRHLLRGLIGTPNLEKGSLEVIASFSGSRLFQEISGELYFDVHQLAIGSWLSGYTKSPSDFLRGEVTLSSWIKIERGKMKEGLLSIKPSFLSWEKQGPHRLDLREGIISFLKTSHGLKLAVDKFDLQTDHKDWLDLKLVAHWVREKKVDFYVSQVDISVLLPLYKLLFNLEERAESVIISASPFGTLNNIRFTYFAPYQYQYSAHLSEGGIQYHSSKITTAEVEIRGDYNRVTFLTNFVGKTYGLGPHISVGAKQGVVTKLVWQKKQQGWTIWSNQISLSTKDFNSTLAFKLDHSRASGLFLSLYTEVDVLNWQHLPIEVPGVGASLTNYLSSAITAGQTKQARLIWYGPLEEPSSEREDGIFQALLPMRDTHLSYHHHWPDIRNLNLDLFFKNGSLYLESNSAESKELSIFKITGEVKHLDPGGSLSIVVSLADEGKVVTKYLRATPLVSSLGSKLSNISLKGGIHSQLKVSIPFNFKMAPTFSGWISLSNNQIIGCSSSFKMYQVSGVFQFKNEVIQASDIRASLLSQSLSLSVLGNLSRSGGSQFHIDSAGNWLVKPLAKYIDTRLIDPLSGSFLWQLALDIQSNDSSYSYQGVLGSRLNNLGSDYPHPLNKDSGRAASLKVDFSGSDHFFSTRINASQVAYHAVIDTSSAQPLIKESSLILGKQEQRVTPVKKHCVSVRLDNLNLDRWLALLRRQDTVPPPRISHHALVAPQFTDLESVGFQVPRLKLAGMYWHDVELKVKKSAVWNLALDSREARGIASYTEAYGLSVSLEQLHLDLPNLGGGLSTTTGSDSREVTASLFQRKIYDYIPDITLSVDSFWLQGYRVGNLKTVLRREHEGLSWNHIDVISGKNEVHANGYWEMDGSLSQVHLDIVSRGEDNSDILERFGISSGIKRAPFLISSTVHWEGTPWSIRTDTLKGQINIELSQGYISDVSGTAKLLGLFSLNSIIRKMKLDFSDIFEDGLLFDSIKGEGEIDKGLFIANSITMDTSAGDMNIKGTVDIGQNYIDAQVKFVPDITSGIPVLSAFAVSPPSAIYVLAVTKVISPMMEIFTEIEYQVKGLIDSPEVREVSRVKGKYRLPNFICDTDKK